MTTRWLTTEQQRAWRMYLVGTTRLRAHLDRSLRERHGLTLSQYEILSRLSDAEHRSLRMAELADSVENSRSRVTHTVARLEAEDLVRREQCDSDGRGVRAVLTDTGYDKLKAAAPDHVRSVRTGLVDIVDPDDLAAVGRAFTAVVNTLQPEQAPVPPTD